MLGGRRTEPRPRSSSDKPRRAGCPVAVPRALRTRRNAAPPPAAKQPAVSSAEMSYALATVTSTQRKEAPCITRRSTERVERAQSACCSVSPSSPRRAHRPTPRRPHRRPPRLPRARRPAQPRPALNKRPALCLRAMLIRRCRQRGPVMPVAATGNLCPTRNAHQGRSTRLLLRQPSAPRFARAAGRRPCVHQLR